MESFTRDQLIFSKGVMVSLGLHGVALALIVSSQQFKSSAEPAAIPERPRSYLQVTTGPRPSATIPDASITEALSAGARGTTDSSRTESSEETAPDESDNSRAGPAPDSTAAEQLADLVTSPSASTSTEIGLPPPDLRGNQSNEVTEDASLGTAQINNSVTAYVTTYKRSLTSDWLSACLRYQNEHGVKTCPLGEDGKSATKKTVNEATSRLFSTYVSGAAASIRASRQLLAEMKVVRSFMKDDSVVGELARQRYQLAQANYCRLNSCRSFALVTSGSFATPVSNEGFINILGIGVGIDPGILSGLVDSIAVEKPAAPVAAFVPYRFTDTRPQQVAREDEFRVKAPLFPVAR